MGRQRAAWLDVSLLHIDDSDAMALHACVGEPHGG
jgi:hypothetical protein